MLKSLIKSTNELRLETLEDVKAYQEEMRQAADDGNYQLANYSWTEKEVKVSGEVVDTYFQVKYTLVFNTLKDPEYYLRSIEYNMVIPNEQVF